MALQNWVSNRQGSRVLHKAVQLDSNCVLGESLGVSAEVVAAQRFAIVQIALFDKGEHNWLWEVVWSFWRFQNNSQYGGDQLCLQMQSLAQLKFLQQ